MSEMEEIKIQKEATELYRKSGLSDTIDFKVFLAAFKIFKRDNPTLIKSASAINGFIGRLLNDPELEDKMYTKVIMKRMDDGNIEEIVKRMVEKELSDLEQSRNEISKSVDPFKHLHTREETSREKEARERKEKWEQGNWIVEHQRQYIAQGGRSRHIPITGAKNSIEPYEGTKYPKSTGKFGRGESLTERVEPNYTDSQKAEFIREMSKDLRATAYRRWSPEQMQFVQMFPDIGKAIMREQDSKKSR